MRADFLLDYDVITVEREHRLYLMARLIAGSPPETTDRRALNLSLVVDRSGSMAGNKIDYTRQAAQLLVQNMGHDDTLSIVLYNESVETLLPPQKVQHKDLINQRIQQIKAGGTTNLSAGWLEGFSHVDDNMHPEHLNRVILMSDGLANRGITAQERLVEIAANKFDGGISTTTMGLGEDFNEDLMMAISDSGGGAFYFIESPEVAPAIFQEELKGLLSVIGQNLTITVEATDHVAGVRQLNAYPEEKRDKGAAFRLGDIFGDEIKTIMLELHIPALKNMGQIEIAKLHFEYDELRDGFSERQTMTQSVVVNVAEGVPELEGGKVNVEVKRSVLLLKAAEARRKAIQLADQGKYKEASAMLREAAEDIFKSGIEDTALEEERGALLSQAKDMEHGADFYHSYSRKSMSTQAYFTERGVHESTQALRFREEKRKNETVSNVGNVGNIDNANVVAGTSNLTDPGANTVEKTGYFEKPVPAEPPAPPTNSAPSGTPPTQVRWGEKVFPLDRDLLRIGRAPQNEIAVNAPGVSRFHAQIKREGSNWVLEDLDSTNGTHLGGRVIEKPVTVHSGDVVYFCDQRIIFEA
jgi:Ca-activated chloride channel family protein